MIKTLNLYRCNIDRSEISNEQKIEYVMMDYFDGVRVDDLNYIENKNITLAEAMGISRQSNSKKGITNQRYCLFTDRDNLEDIFQRDEELPVLTVIQVFINPDIFQADSFEDGKEISCEECIKRTEECIRRKYDEETKLKWQIFQLVTDGDFAIIVRSRNVHISYDISSLIRSIRISVAGNVQTNAFYSYTITGVMTSTCSNESIQVHNEKINWNQYLEKEDQVILRLIFSSKFRTAQKPLEAVAQVDKFLKMGYRLFGRYDFQIALTPTEFEQIYPLLRDFKFVFKNNEEAMEEKSKAFRENENLQLLFFMLQNRYIDYFNERILLKYNEDLFSEDQEPENFWNWEVVVKSEWTTLYNRNLERIEEQKDYATEMAERLEKYFQSARNLKEYTRLMVRIYRVLYEMNYRQELRINVANLIQQLTVMQNSMRLWLDQAEEYKWPHKYIASQAEEYLRLGMSAMEIFTRYVRNVNLHSFQTPNYDLQTNECIEKVLLAYSQFLQPFMTRKEEEQDNGYIRTGSYFPVIVPSMAVRDLSVSVLFDYKDGNLHDKNEKMMVVSSPTFFFLCETCFMIPTSFHEIAHHFRYESRRIRNTCLTKYLLKSIIFDAVSKVLDSSKSFRLDNIKEVIEFTDDIYTLILEESGFKSKLDCDMLTFTGRLKRMLNAFFRSVQLGDNVPEKMAMQYIDDTKNDVLVFDDDLVNLIQDIVTCAKSQKDWNTEEVLKEKCHDLQNKLEKLRELQCRQLMEEITALIASMGEDVRVQMTPELEHVFDSESNLKMDELSTFWSNFEKINQSTVLKNDVRECVKKINHVMNMYIRICAGFQKFCSTYVVEDLKNRAKFAEISKKVYMEIVVKLDEFEHKRAVDLDMQTIGVTGDELQYLKKEIKIGGEAWLCKRIKEIFNKPQQLITENFIQTEIDWYREVTSDLFMCSIMGLSAWGYLVIVAATFVFNQKSKLAQYRRVALVVECLIQHQNEDSFNQTLYMNSIAEMFDKEIRCLMEQFYSENKKIDICSVESTAYKDVRERISDLNNITEQMLKEAESDKCTSTQKWILRIYFQIGHILYNIAGRELMKDQIFTKEIWDDVTGTQSYLKQKEKLREVLSQYGGKELCEGIRDILNSPAKFYTNRKSLLQNEVKFVLEHYKNSCQSVFK